MPNHQATSEKRRFRFFQWNDMHLRAPHLIAQYGIYPFVLEKAVWAIECAKGLHGLEAPDFILSAGDLINGEIPDYSHDFCYLKDSMIASLEVPLLPCLGNHENGQGEGIPEKNVAYDQCFGPQWHHYAFTVKGIAFIVVDTSGGYRPPDEVTDARNAFVERAFQFVKGTPVIVVTHTPLIAMRAEAALKESFGFPGWKVKDGRMLQIVEAHADEVIAVLSGHLHLTGVRLQKGIYHIMPAGTSGYPSDFASYDVFPDRIEVRMHRAPDQWLDRNGGNIHGKPRHRIDYTDVDHPDHESYLWGNSSERQFPIPLEGYKRPRANPDPALTVYHETAPHAWITSAPPFKPAQKERD